VYFLSYTGIHRVHKSGWVHIISVWVHGEKWTFWRSAWILLGKNGNGLKTYETSISLRVQYYCPGFGDTNMRVMWMQTRYLVQHMPTASEIQDKQIKLSHLYTTYWEMWVIQVPLSPAKAMVARYDLYSTRVLMTMNGRSPGPEQRDKITLRRQGGEAKPNKFDTPSNAGFLCLYLQRAGHNWKQQTLSSYL
jgi:hypothetical protein